MQLAGKVALITGGGEGIGRATALLFAREGAKVAVLGRHRENLDPVVDQIAAEHGEAIPVCADVSQPDEMQAAIEEIVRKWGRLDIVFANAGINGVWAPLEELEPEEWDKTLSINLKGTFLTVKYAVPHLKKARRLRHRELVHQRHARLQQHGGERVLVSPRRGRWRSPRWWRWSWRRGRCA